MEGTARIWFTPQQRAELWERWKNGQCVADIARALERRNTVWPRQCPRVGHLPLKSGDRFSLNEVIPSRRSSVGMVL